MEPIKSLACSDEVSPNHFSTMRNIMTIDRLIAATAYGLMLAQVLTSGASAADPKGVADSKEVAATVQNMVQEVGGREKLLTLFSMKESLILNPDGIKKGSERFSVLEPPSYWWLNKKDRAAEPAKFLVWAWTLGALIDPKSKLAMLPETTDNAVPLVGIEVSETIMPPMKIYFDKKESRLVRIDWRSHIHRFSEWKDLNGLKYPSRTIGYNVSDGKAWYQSDILELIRLTDLPEGLSR